MFATAGEAVTGEKPQSKLWYHDGSYWGIVEGASGVAIYEKVGNTWVRSNAMDAILCPTGQADVKWDGTSLFVLVFNGTPQLFRYTYDAQLRLWNLASGFPVPMPRPSGAETMVLDEDSTGRLWAVAEGGSDINVYCTTSADDRSWSASPVVLRKGVAPDDICTVVAFGGDKIGVFWSDQARDEFGFRIHHDGADMSVWDSEEVVDAGSGFADDHISLAADATGRVYAITKDDFDRMQVHRRAVDGTWSTVRDVTGAIGTRGIIQLSEADQLAYILYTAWNVVPNSVCYRVANMSDLQFGATVTFITSSSNLNNVTGTKQSLPSGTLVALCEGGAKVWENSFEPSGNQGPQAPAAPSNLAAVLQTVPMRVELSWTASSTTVDGYDVYVQVDGAASQKVNAAPVVGTSYTHLNPPAGNLCYHLTAVRGAQTSASTSPSCVSNQSIAPPGTPVAVTATPIVAGSTQGVLALWCDTGAGQVETDLSGNGNDASLGSTAGTDTADPLWTAGVAGQALQFDGSNDYVSVTDAPSFDMAGSFTIEAWVNRGNTKIGCILDKGAVGKRTYRLMVTAAGGLEFSWDDAAGVQRIVTSAALLFKGTGWHHVACVYDANALQNRIYFDGALRATGVGIGVPAANSSPFYLGVYPSGTSLKSPFAGAIDAVHIVPGALYAADFTPVANPLAPPAAGPRSVLVRWAPPTSGSTVGSYRVDRAYFGNIPATLNTAAIIRTVFTDELAPSAQLQYSVTALNTHGDPGIASAPVIVDLRTGPAPLPPQNLLAALDENALGHVHVTWSPPMSGPPAGGYLVYRRLNAAPFALLTSTPVADTTLVDSTSANASLCYFAKALDADGDVSAASDTACVTYVAPPLVGAPLALTATPADTIVAGTAVGAMVLGLDEGTGQVAADATGNGNNATLGTATTVETSDPTWVAGVNGSALRFDGSNDRIKVLDVPGLRFTNSFTVEAWVRRSSFAAEHAILSKGDSNKRNYMVLVQADGHINFTWQTSGGTTHGATSAATLMDANWHHVACVYDQAASRSRIFLDGILATNVVDSGTPITSLDPLYVGARVTAGTVKSFFAGTIDLVRVAPGALYSVNFTPPTSYTQPVAEHVVRLAWQAPAYGTPTGYRIYRQAEGQPFVLINSSALVTGTSFIDEEPLAGVACYHVTAMDANAAEGDPSDPACTGVVKARGSQNELPAVPVVLSLAATPNPFNPATALQFALPAAAPVHLVIYDVRGARVTTLVNGTLPAGTHIARWNGRTDSGANAASGVYFAQLQAGAATKHLKLLLLK